MHCNGHRIQATAGNTGARKRRLPRWVAAQPPFRAPHEEAADYGESSRPGNKGHWADVTSCAPRTRGPRAGPSFQ